MLKKFNFDYDPVHDMLFIYNPDCKSKGSAVLGDLVIDFNNKGKITAVELLSASSFLENLEFDQKETQDFLENIVDCKLDIREMPDFFVIKMILKSPHKKLSTPIMVPNLSEPHPALYS